MRKLDISCPFCRETYTYDFTQDELYSIECNSDISNAQMPAYKRELFITGLCYKCQSKAFHTSTPGYYLGEVVGNCPCCGANVYDTDLKTGICAICNEEISNTLCEGIL